MSVLEENKQRRRQQILEAAENLIRQENAVNFSMETLAREAGVSFATPFNLFGRKNDILGALISARVDAQLAKFEVSGREDALAGVLELADDSSEIYLSDPGLYRPVIRTVLTERLASSYTPPEKVLEMWRLAIAPAIEAGDVLEGAPIDEVVKLLHLAYTSALLYWANRLFTDEVFRVQARHLVVGSFSRWLNVSARDRLIRLL